MSAFVIPWVGFGLILAGLIAWAVRSTNDYVRERERAAPIPKPSETSRQEPRKGNEPFHTDAIKAASGTFLAPQGRG